MSAFFRRRMISLSSTASAALLLNNTVPAGSEAGLTGGLLGFYDTSSFLQETGTTSLEGPGPGRSKDDGVRLRRNAICHDDNEPVGPVCDLFKDSSIRVEWPILVIRSVKLLGPGVRPENGGGAAIEPLMSSLTFSGDCSY